MTTCTGFIPTEVANGYYRDLMDTGELVQPEDIDHDTRYLLFTNAYPMEEKTNCDYLWGSCYLMQRYSRKKSSNIHFAVRAV